MATLVLTAVGTLVGGPIGGAIGSIIGQQIDKRLFAPKGRQGPRLNELAIQSSAYGSAIPKLFGTNRVAGTVIWATSLKETRRKVSNGKGQPKSTVYSYSTSFAVALSARRIVRVGRIWADGNLLRGTAGDFKTETRFRLHDGNEGQPVDPLIASAEGIAMTPAYRGLAYAVFENFQLADYGNRIPSLSFEVIADEGDVSIGTILTSLAGPRVMADSPARIQGFAANGDSVRGVAETLAGLFPFAVRDDGEVLQLEAMSKFYERIADIDLGARQDDKALPRIARERRSETTLPANVSVAHYEPARDYQQGLQRVRDGGGGRRELRIDIPITLDAARVKSYAMSALHRLRAERNTARIRLPWRYLDLAPGRRIIVPGDRAAWRVSGVILDRMVVEADLTQFGAASGQILASDPGRNVSQADVSHGPTVFHLLDLPPLDDTVATSPRVAVAAAGQSSGWRRASLMLSFDDGESWQEVGATASPAMIGTIQTPLASASALLFDETNALDVTLLNDSMQLHSCSTEALNAGANAALVGSELVQFRSAEPLGDNRFRLSGLLRGRRGTEWAIQSHLAGERFILAEREAFSLIDVPPGTELVRVMAIGIADMVPPEQSLARPIQALLPPAPVHVRARVLTNGDIEISWVRRSRNGWRWLDGVDAPLAEETERFSVTLMADPGQAQTTEQSETRLLYPASKRATDRANGSERLKVSICQIGNFGMSRSATITFPLI